MVSPQYQIGIGGLSRRQFLRVGGAALVAGGSLLTSVPPAQAVTINPRSSWAIDRPPLGPLPNEDVRFLLVHHSASQNGHTTADAPGILRGFYDYHTGPEKGWNDIAYNFLIDAGGGVWEGRSGSIAGSIAGDATGGNQGYSQLVCVIGDYNAINPTDASLSSLVSLLAWLADKHGLATAPGSTATFISKGSNKWPEGASVTTETITGHRNMSLTTCPGDNLFSYVAGSLMADVTATRSGEPVVSTAPPSTVATTTTTLATTTSVQAPAPLASLTSTLPDPTPTPGPTSRQAGDVTAAEPAISSDPVPTVTLPPAKVVAAETVVSSGPSPLLWGGAALATLATAMLAWRFRRMS